MADKNSAWSCLKGQRTNQDDKNCPLQYLSKQYKEKALWTRTSAICICILWNINCLLNHEDQDLHRFFFLPLKDSAKRHQTIFLLWQLLWIPDLGPGYLPEITAKWLYDGMGLFTEPFPQSQAFVISVNDIQELYHICAHFSRQKKCICVFELLSCSLASSTSPSTH